MKTIESLDSRQNALKDLQVIPGVGPSIAQDLYSLGIRRVADLKTKKPEFLYHRLEKLTGHRQDPCVLYTFRCAVYFARTPKPQKKKLLWWNWMNPRPSPC